MLATEKDAPWRQKTNVHLTEAAKSEISIFSEFDSHGFILPRLCLHRMVWTKLNWMAVYR